MPGSPYYFLDMELCDFNLATSIREWRTRTYKIEDEASRFEDIGHVFKSISNGMGFIHLQGETHRDLKPQNGIYPLF
jgi:serine/threonine protein kinase